MIIHVKVIPNSKEEELKEISKLEYTAKIKEPAEKNRANISLTNLLAKSLKIPAKNIKIKNPLSRKKVIDIINQQQQF